MKRTLFMHIPKTAGTSVLRYLREVYAARPRLELRSQDNSLAWVTADAVASAANIWLHEPLCHLKADTSAFFRFTFLRHPVERVGSLYAYLRDPAVIARQDFTHTSEKAVTSLRNIGRMSFKDFILSDDPEHIGHIADIYPYYFAAQSPGAFATTQDYLRHCGLRMEQCFDLIGDISHLSEDMDLIHEHCFPKHKHAFQPLRFNESNKQRLDLRLSSEMEERLEGMLALDFALFREARLLRLEKREALEGGWLNLLPLGRFQRRSRSPSSNHPANNRRGALLS